MTRSIPWPRILAEGVAIVVSILLAFGIQAWWEGRQESQEQEARLSQVVRELEASDSSLQRAGGFHTDYSELAAELRRRLARSEGQAIEVPDSLVGWLLVATVTEVPFASTASYLAWEGVADIEEGEVEQALRRWLALLEDLRDDEVFNRDFVSNEFGPFFRASFDVADAYYRSVPPTVGQGLPPSDGSVRLVSTPHLRNLLSWREQRERALMETVYRVQNERSTLVSHLRAILNPD